MKNLTPIVFAVVFITLVAVFGEAGQSNRVAAEVCVPSEPITIPGVSGSNVRGVLAVEFQNMRLASVTVANEGHVKAGFYSEVSVVNGKLASGTPSLPPRPGTCRTQVVLDGPRATIKCASNNCTTACGLNSYIGPGGVDQFVCECNYGPLPSPGPNPKPD